MWGFVAQAFYPEQRRAACVLFATGKSTEHRLKPVLQNLRWVNGLATSEVVDLQN
jgi:hypothetical protein